MSQRTGKNRFGTTPLTVVLLVTVCLSLWLGYEAFAAARDHRAAVEATLRDYTAMAAWELSRLSRESMHWYVEEVFDGFRDRGGEGSLETLEREMAEAVEWGHCDCPSLRAPLASIRIRYPGMEVTALPDTLDPAVIEQLTAAIGARVAGDPESHRGFILTGAGELLDGPAAIGYTVRGRRGEPSAHAYAFVVPMAGVGELVAHGYGRNPLLPPTAGRTPVNDSLLHAEVRAPDGTPLFTSPGPGQPGLASRDTVAAEWGALQVEVTVRPDAAEKLVAGGMPPPRTPLFLAMIALVAIAGAAGLVLIRREGELARLRDDFVSGVSHELRTPLAQIRMFAELQAAGKLRTEEDRRRAVAVIDREARRLTHLVENVLQFTRLRRASEPVAGRSSLDLERALTEAVDGFRPLMESRDMRIRLESEPGLRAEMSSGSFRQILDNFLDNALKYGPPGQTVTVRAQSTEKGARVMVDDEGPGVPRGERRRIWEAYRRLDRDTGGRQRGSGIGLAVVATLVEQHGGRAWVEASPAGGARFVAEVPGRTAPDRSAVRVEEVPA